MIVARGNDYIVEVKGNQPKLKKEVKQVTQTTLSIDKFNKEEKNRGRIEKRQTEVYDQVESINSQWVGIKRIIKVKRSGTRNKKEYNEEHYYISSLKNNDAKTFFTAIRSHWGIENNLHRVKDVNMIEDKNGIKVGVASQNLSLIKSMVINIFRLNGFDSVKYATRKFTNRIKNSLKLIEKCHILKF